MNDIVYAGLLTAPHGLQPQVHDQWELVFCLSGGGEYVIGSQTLSFAKGDMVAVPPLMPHYCGADRSLKLVQILIDQPTLLMKEASVIHGDGSPHLQAAFEAALYHYCSEHPAKANLLTVYGSLLACYLAAYSTGYTLSPVVTEIEKDIRDRFSDPAYELEAYLHSLPFNYDYLRKLFQREIGVTPLQYLNSLRLYTAAEALLHTENAAGSVADIARMCGFREPLYFSRMFKKKYGLSPTHYAAAKAGTKRTFPGKQELTPAGEEA